MPPQISPPSMDGFQLDVRRRARNPVEEVGQEPRDCMKSVDAQQLDRHLLQQVVTARRQAERSGQRLAVRLEKIKRETEKKSKQAENMAEKFRMHQAVRDHAESLKDMLQEKTQQWNRRTMSKRADILRQKRGSEASRRNATKFVFGYRKQVADEIRTQTSENRHHLTQIREEQTAGLQKKANLVKGSKEQQRQRKQRVQDSIRQKIQRQRMARLVQDHERGNRAEEHLERLKKREAELMESLKNAQALHESVSRQYDYAFHKSKDEGAHSGTSPTGEPASDHSRTPLKGLVMEFQSPLAEDLQSQSSADSPAAASLGTLGSCGQQYSDMTVAGWGSLPPSKTARSTSPQEHAYFTSAQAGAAVEATIPIQAPVDAGTGAPTGAGAQTVAGTRETSGVILSEA